MQHLPPNYQQFYTEVEKIVSKKYIFTDPLHTLAYGTDASFYRLIPKIVLWIEKSNQINKILKLAYQYQLPVVFRAAGTSLSGQAITDSILVVTSRDWRDIEVNDDASLVTLSPSVIGADANEFLKPYGKKIGPDPASIKSAMIGGISANNASGMCCGVADNSYKTMHAMKIVFCDGSELNTADKRNRENFIKTHGFMIEAIKNLALKVKKDEKLREKIIRKFKIKNTCGYSLNALVDFEDPIEIISHLMIGSEGTLGFIKEITLKTVPEYDNKASSLMIFKNIKDACDAVIILKTKCKYAVDAAEIMDRAALKSVENNDGMPEILKELDENACALLVETRAKDSQSLQENIDIIKKLIKNIIPVVPIQFTDIKEEYELFWSIRKGLFPAVGAVREKGTTVIIEDVAFPIEQLADGTLKLQSLFKKYEYNEAIIFGHSLEGNLHFVFTQKFDNDKEIKRYEKFMADVANLVAVEYKGSLKAEHGTGRNMAPFVELEWGSDAYTIMKEIKSIFDPKKLINPGVILNDDKQIHLKNFKFMPPTDELIDKCIECGYCEPKCPSNFLTLTPRQRIVTARYLSELRVKDREEDLKEFEKIYQYDAIETCATCSLCSLSCPVGIDTGSLTKKLRAKQVKKIDNYIANKISDNYSIALGTTRVSLNLIHGVSTILRPSNMKKLSQKIRVISGNKIPLWLESLPSGNKFEVKKTIKYSPNKVVYFSSCINRTMTNSKPEKQEKPIFEVVVKILEKAGYEVIIPTNVDNLCCGMPFSSKGYNEAGNKKSKELENALRIASKNGKYPILCDMSPCSKTMRENFSHNIKVEDSAEFILNHLVDKLEFKKIDEPIVIHTTCSTRKSGLTDKLIKVANMCSSKVIVPKKVSCCGFAGDRGFTYPELNKSALRHLKSEIPKNVKLAFSTSKTCEIGLSEYSGLKYKSIFYLIEKCIE